MTNDFFPASVDPSSGLGELRCSKWLRHAVLLEREEMKEFLRFLEPCLFISPVKIVHKENWQIREEDILASYEQYLRWIRSNPEIPPAELRKEFTLMLSPAVDSFYSLPVGADRFLIKARIPPVQIRMYHCFISSVDGKILPMAMNVDSFTFGLEISYPQIYEDRKTGEFKKVLLDKGFSATPLYKKISGWLRKHTKPAPIEIRGKKVMAPFRMGKETSDPKSFYIRFANALEKVNT